MAVKSVRLSVGSIFHKGPGKIYFYRYQVDGHRKTVSLQTTNCAEALRKAEEFIPIIKATSTEVIAAYVQQVAQNNTPKLRNSIKIRQSGIINSGIENHASLENGVITAIFSLPGTN